MAIKRNTTVVISDAGQLDWSSISGAPVDQITDVKLNTTIGNCVGGLSGTLVVSVAANGAERAITFSLTGTNCYCDCNCQCECQC